MVIFMGSYEGKSKTSGNDFQRVTLLEVRKSKKTDEVVSKQVDFFVNKLDCTKLKCGDVVHPEFEEPEILGGSPELVGLEAVGDNVFAQWIE